MSTHYAKRLTRSFVATQTTTGMELFLTSDFQTWFSANQENVTQIGTKYIVNPTNTKSFSVIVDPLMPSGATIPTQHSLKDLGREIRIGTVKEPSLIVFRLVQIPGLSSNNGTPDNYNNASNTIYSGTTGYVVIANNASDTSSFNDMYVYVSRV